MDPIVTALVIVATAIVALIIGIVIGFLYRKKVAEAQIGSAEEQAKRIVEEGIKSAEAKKKEALIEAKEEILKSKTESENELKERRKEVTRLESRLNQKEEQLDKKIEQIEDKSSQLDKKIKENEKAAEEIKASLEKQIATLEKISGMSADQAKEELMLRIEGEVKHKMSIRMLELEAQFKDEADMKAKNILSQAIQRCAPDFVGEVTVSSVNLPNDDMKGRIIGREGRNIRAIETLTGVDLIIDDTPEAITISAFDPVRREIARIALEKLISDGRIHPARIEETVEKARKEVDAAIKAAGEKAVIQTGVHGLNQELVRLLGRLKYRTSYGQNVLQHSMEVSFLSGIIADELGIDSTLARRAGLLHDIGKALTQEVEGSHIQIGVDLAKKYKENKEVIHAIEAHHGDVEPTTLVAIIVQAADAVSAARPGARREELENYIKRLTKLEEITNSFDGVEKSFAIQAGREVRIMVKPDQVSDAEMLQLAHDIVTKIESELEYPGQIKVNLIRESRTVDYAK
ncbi:MAG: ribonuclease Y [Clostridia bacterium]|nr:ribonuclease Y [Clostridia bacterium]